MGSKEFRLLLFSLLIIINTHVDEAVQQGCVAKTDNPLGLGANKTFCYNLRIATNNCSLLKAGLLTAFKLQDLRYKLLHFTAEMQYFKMKSNTTVPQSTPK